MHEAEWAAKTELADDLKRQITALGWERFPKFAEMFEHRPTKNIYWHELAELVSALQCGPEL